jgi:hypothetical protein
MVTLLAYAPDERWAFAREGDRVVLVRPPFHHDVATSEAEVERAVTVHGFVAIARDFATRRALLDFLGDESVRVWKERAPAKDLTSLRDDLLAALTVADLDRQIDRAGKKIDGGEHDEAQTLLNRLLTAAALTREHRTAIAGMQQRAQTARNEDEERRRRALRPLVSARYRRTAGAPLPGRAIDDESPALHPAA